ncbi:hypothetical protein BOVATA_011680 [Babesia ovata]|uniref:Uncharacterized protein n=1 Tax=Babesia ovata TaxID=189622 RepID=A0A2H6K9L5_9APIC|nr:uncharacterized protein BOVATA_011680 [Babesia ovata]GBE59675.1 hypothetical protein BOVATA_011680 [Babesia ovata]
MRNIIVFALVILSQIAIAAPGNKKQQQDDITVTGLVVIKDKTYRATCNCPAHVKSLENMIYISRGLCYPSKVKVRTHGAHDPDEYKMLVDGMHLIPHEDFTSVHQHPLSAMDGRLKGKAFYAPGGDLGIFILAMLNMYENDGIPTQKTVTNMLREYIRQISNGRDFRHAVDEKSLESIRNALKWELIDLTNIDPPHQKAVKDAISAGAYGNPFLNFLVRKFRSNPSKKTIVVECINAFFEIVWDKSDSIWERMVVQLLEGEHKPRALVELSVSKGCELARMAPLVTAKVEDMQLLIYTEFAANYRKREVATFIYNQQDTRKRTLPLDEVLQHLDKLTHTVTEEFGKY